MHSKSSLERRESKDGERSSTYLIKRRTMLTRKPKSPLRYTSPHSLNITTRILSPNLKVTITTIPTQLIFLPFSRQDSLDLTIWVRSRVIRQQGDIRHEECGEESVVFGFWEVMHEGCDVC